MRAVCFELLEQTDSVPIAGRLVNGSLRSSSINFLGVQTDSQPPGACWPLVASAWLPPPGASPLAALSERPCSRVTFSSSTYAPLSSRDTHKQPLAALESPGRQAAQQAAVGASSATSRHPSPTLPRGVSFQSALECLVQQQQQQQRISGGKQTQQEPTKRRTQMPPSFASVLAAHVEAQRRSTVAAAAFKATGLASSGRQALEWDEAVQSERIEVRDDPPTEEDLAEDNTSICFYTSEQVPEGDRVEWGRQVRHLRRRRFWRARWGGLINYGKHLLSGAMSAVVSRSAVAPFERVKMELLLHQNTAKASAVAMEILKREGVFGFWRSNTLNLLRTAPYKAVNFASYDAFKLLLQGSDPAVELSRIKGFVAGAMAGVTACMLCFPLDLLRTRILAEPLQAGIRHAGIMVTLRAVLRNEGFCALYGGCLPALMSVGPSGAVFYGVYDLLKSKHLADLRQADGLVHERLSGMYSLLYGAIAGGTAESAVYPLIVVQRRIQMATMKAAQISGRTAGAALAQRGGLTGIRSAAAELYRIHGLRGFYIGYLPNILQVLPNAALSYYAYETFKAALAVD